MNLKTREVKLFMYKVIYFIKSNIHVFFLTTGQVQVHKLADELF